MKTLFLVLSVLAISVDAVSWATFQRRSDDGVIDRDLAELGRKWGVMCDLFDVDRNGRLGPDDLNTIIKNFLKVNSVPPRNIATVRKQLRDFWGTFVIRRPNGDTVTRRDCIKIRRDLYTSNRAQFNTAVENSMSAFTKFLDIDNDGIVDRAEIDNVSKVFDINPLPHWDALLKNYGGSGIPIEFLSKNIILFREKPEDSEFQKLFKGGIEEDHN